MPGNWTTLAPTNFNVGTMLLLTDGTVICHEEDAQGFGTSNFHRLTPDVLGNYASGTWSALPSLPNNPIIPAGVGGPTNAPLYFASAVLRDGRVFLAGGEYNLHHGGADILASQIYDPVTNAWTIIAPPPGWTKIGDAASCVLPDGKVLLGFIDDTKTAIYDPVTNAWTAVAGKANKSSEETWTLLPDGTVLTANCFGHPHTEKFVAASNTWVTAGQTPAGNDLVDDPTKEIGPALLLPDGRVFAIGASGKNAFYTKPAIPALPGAWAAAPAFPQINGKTLGATDGPAALLPNGRVLCVAGPVSSNCNDPVNQGYCPPTYFFEFDPVASTVTQIADPGNNPGPPGNATFKGRMLLLPSGQVLFANGSNSICLYEPGGAPNPAWKPVITSCPTSLQPGQTYTLQGTQLTGLSQANSYGDDAQMATNFPLVRITDLSSNRVYYCRTANHSSMAVAAGATPQSTQFTVPAGVMAGTYNLTVVANGIPSDPLVVTIGKSDEGEDSMSTSILNVWISKLGEPCKIQNDFDNSRFNWVVSIFHCDGDVLNWSEGRYRFHRDDPWIPIKKHVPPGGTSGWWYDSVPTKDGHVEIELPPGCYVVRATLHSWFQNGRLFGNWATDRSIVQVCCGEHVCTTLYAPTAQACHIVLFDMVYPLLQKHGLIDRKAADILKQAGGLLHVEGASGFEQGEAKTLRYLMEQMGPDAPKE